MFVNYIKKKIWIWKNNYKVSDEDKNTIFEHTNTKLWLWANYIIIFLILLSVVIVWLDTLPGFDKKYWFEIFITDFIISTVFLFEYLYRWKYSSHKGKFPFRIMNILDLLSFLPFFILIAIYWIWLYSFFTIFRLLRVFRIFELVERIPIVTKIWKWINNHKVEYITALFVIVIILVLFSTLVYISEQNWWNATTFNSIPKTFWWAVVTMTTTWYWDMVPISLAWKIMAGILMILWPILVTILSTITVIIFIESTKIININSNSKKCGNCRTENDIDAKYCKKCWNKI